jgi:hypothetical protein
MIAMSCLWVAVTQKVKTFGSFQSIEIGSPARITLKLKVVQ